VAKRNSTAIDGCCRQRQKVSRDKKLARSRKTSANHQPQKQPQSQVVAVYVPRVELSAPRLAKMNSKNLNPSSFKNAFMQTLRGQGIGLLTAHLYHEPTHDTVVKEVQDSSTDAALKARPGRLLYGGFAWEAFVQEGGTYDIMDSDMNAIEAALKGGLIDKLPKVMSIIEYGPGGKSGVRKPAHLLNAIKQHASHKIVNSYTAVDILNRFATESALEIHEEFNVRAFAVVGDFTSKNKLALPRVSGSVPVAASFGGGFANAPDYSPIQGRNGKSNASVHFSQMNRQHGIGSYLLMTYHCERDPATLMAEYRRTENLEAFILSGFMRAIGEGVITDKHYNPYSHWEMDPTYDDRIHAVIEYAVCKDDHKVETKEQTFHFKQGDRIPITLSHKWNKADYRDILGKAGYEIVNDASNENESCPHGIILARAVRKPSYP
jgi:uncharacterized SAM-dependent methyltransferase